MNQLTSQTQRQSASTPLPASGILQRKCACGNHTPAGGECGTCSNNRLSLQRRAVDNRSELSEVPPIVHDVLRSAGQPLDMETRSFMEPRFGHDFSQVRVHTDSRAAESASAVKALAYTVGRDVVFGARQYEPTSRSGQRLLAHELAHTVQQERQVWGVPAAVPTLGDPHSRSETEADRVADAIDQGADVVRIGESLPARVARLCTTAATCSPGTVIAGSAEDFGVGEEAIEAGPRARRQRMTPARAVSSGHAGRALQLERFLTGQDPTRLGNIEGIFIDHDLSPGTDGLTQDCAEWITESLPSGAPTPPGMAGATKLCTFVRGRLNQEALRFNSSTAPRIGGRSREQWRIDTLQLLTHETEHPRFETATAGAPLPPGVTTATCSRANLLIELSELAAGLSEFPAIVRPALAEANPTGPLHRSMDAWFRKVASTGGENFSGALTKMGCLCDCAEIDAHVSATFDEVTTSNAWTVPERTEFNSRMRVELPVGTRPSWPL